MTSKQSRRKHNKQHKHAVIKPQQCLVQLMMLSSWQREDYRQPLIHTLRLYYNRRATFRRDTGSRVGRSAKRRMKRSRNLWARGAINAASLSNSTQCNRFISSVRIRIRFRAQHCMYTRGHHQCRIN